jgi:hypothetical protein
MRPVLIKSSHFITASETNTDKDCIAYETAPSVFPIVLLPCRHCFVCKPSFNSFPGKKNITI